MAVFIGLTMCDVNFIDLCLQALMYCTEREKTLTVQEVACLNNVALCDIFIFWNHKLMIHQDWVTHTKAEHNLFHIGQREVQEEKEQEYMWEKASTREKERERDIDVAKA